VDLLEFPAVQEFVEEKVKERVKDLLQEKVGEKVHEALLDVLEGRFGSVSPTLVSKLRAVKEETKLKELSREAGRCASPEAFEAPLPSCPFGRPTQTGQRGLGKGPAARLFRARNAMASRALTTTACVPPR